MSRPLFGHLIPHAKTGRAGPKPRWRVLVAELQHRTRNLLGVIRSITDQTLARSSSLDEFRDAFQERLKALARVNGLLSRLNDRERITFTELVRSELLAIGM